METNSEQEREVNFSALLTGLLLILIGWPAAQEIFGHVEGIYVQIAFTGLLVVGLWSFHRSRHWFIAGTILAIVQGDHKQGDHKDRPYAISILIGT
jgi:high-affinity Fe2+/Pb2+ permease